MSDETDNTAEPPDSVADAIPDGLMQGTDQWWHFLDHKPSRGGLGEASVGDLETGLEVEDVSRRPDRRAGLRPTGQSFRCNRCRHDNPADLPFCIHCGQEARSALHSRTELFVLDGLADDADVRRYVADIFAQASRITVDEIDAMLADEPAYFQIHGYPGQLEALAERLDELGVSVRTLSPTAPSSGWYREIGESILRDSRQTALFGSVGVATLLGTLFVTFWTMILGAGLIYWLFQRRMNWYRDRYLVENSRVLEAVSGFSTQLAGRARRLLDQLEGSEVGEYLSACLMEHYTIWHRLAPKDAVSGALHKRVRRLASDLIGQIVDSCEAYADLHQLLQDYEEREASGQLVDAPDIQEARSAEEAMRQKLGRMAAALESLRLRAVSATSRRSGAGLEADRSLDELVEEVELELDVVAETTEAVHS